ncbi:uncharacterized protein RHO25_003146 [Cercospora beticola]|uniref:Uncharacterized protein n=1 Tax=Cercospora beticola TaxID=122368 RepID=A0ABZ0NGD8_CERBT|nr:hypothetical protein RHO25_003146 [Cercospora beticola]
MWLCADDGDRVQLLSDLVGRTILTALDAVQQVGQLKKDSVFKDLGVVMASFFSAPSAEWADIELVLDDVSETNWREAIVAYALKADIDLHHVGVADVEGTLGKELPRPIEDNNKDWKLSSSLDSYWGYHMSRPIRGGKSFNICQWTRQERAKWHFDHEDPLKDFPEDVIKSGELVPA